VVLAGPIARVFPTFPGIDLGCENGLGAMPQNIGVQIVK
jgi:hypothetical protein